eukprot:TRINITY_DN109_c0_g1_i1.p1 TRINITY_DN109_c0_g1~~TRINITY_DN109_c0_g1_i1.p1  ORF type:complete len:309 (+),score=41.90 TRINITY_DN109_c0_g1_i1:96-929(+)
MITVSQLFFICLLATSANALLRIGMTEFLSELFPEFINFKADGECAPSFECDIIGSVCVALGEDCVIVPLPDLDSRFGSLETGDVDVTISISSVTPDRSERVHFVRPHYYYAGAQIFVLDSVPESEHPTWKELEGKDVCILKDYYAIDGIQFAYGPNLIPSDTNASLILDGTCEYIVTDSTDIIDGTVASTKALIEFGAPYGIAVAHEDRDTLGQLIGDALVDMMDDGKDSEMLMLEEKYLVSYGFPFNVKLSDVVMAVTAAGAALPPEVEDAIWDE